MKTEIHKTINHTFEKIQGKVYTTINGKQLQVKEKFSMNEIYNIQSKLK